MQSRKGRKETAWNFPNWSLGNRVIIFSRKVAKSAK